MLTSKQVNELTDNNKMIYSFDIDNTLVNFFSGIPNKELIEHIRRCFENGNYIYIETARLKNTKRDTVYLLQKYNIPYHCLIMDRPKVHLRIDDLCINVNKYVNNPSYYDEKFKNLGNKINAFYRTKKEQSVYNCDKCGYRLKHVFVNENNLYFCENNKCDKFLKWIMIKW